jgi:hypothetical protein
MCNVCLAQHSQTIRSIKLHENFPVLNKQGKLDSFIPFNSRLFYYKHLVMIELEYQFDSSINDKLLKSETRHRYLIYNKGSRVGNLYDEGQRKETTNVSVDSTLKPEWFNNIYLYEIFRQNNVTLISSIKDRKTGRLKEEYSIVAKNDTSQKGFGIFYFTNQLKNVDFSLSPELDSIKGMKLDSVRIINEARFYKAANIWIDRIEETYKMEEDTAFDKAKILEYFKKYGNADN